MYVCIYVCVCIYIYIWVCAQVQEWYINMYIDVFAFVFCPCICSVGACVYICCMYACTCVRIHIHPYQITPFTHKHKNVYMHTYFRCIHMCLLTCVRSKQLIHKYYVCIYVYIFTFRYNMPTHICSIRTIPLKTKVSRYWMDLACKLKAPVHCAAEQPTLRTSFPIDVTSNTQLEHVATCMYIRIYMCVYNMT